MNQFNPGLVKKISIDWLYSLSLGLVFSIVLFYNAAVISGLSSFSYIGLLGILITVSILYWMLPDTFSRIFFLVSLTICLPMISHPVEMLPHNVHEAIKNLIVYGDRIQIRFIILTLISFYLFFEISLKLSLKQSNYLLYLTIFTTLLLIVVFSHEYNGYSILQVILDLGQILVGAAIFCYFRASPNESFSLNRIEALVQTTFSFLCLILLIDICITLSGIVSWTVSWRGGIQGLFFAFEGPYAYTIGIALAYFLARMNYLSFVFLIILILGATVLILTNIKSAVAALLAASLLMPLLKYKALNKLAFPIVVLFISLLVFYLLNSEETNSVAARFGTYITYVFTWIEGSNWIFGIKPGVTEFSGPANLSNALFASDFASNIFGVNENLIEELLVREGREEGGAFLPHNAFLSLISSYGIILLIPSAYYYLYLPWLILKNTNPSNKLIHSLSSVIIFIALYSFLHPMIILVPLVFFVEILRFFSLEKLASAR